VLKKESSVKLLVSGLNIDLDKCNFPATGQTFFQKKQKTFSKHQREKKCFHGFLNNSNTVFSTITKNVIKHKKA